MYTHTVYAFTGKLPLPCATHIYMGCMPGFELRQLSTWYVENLCGVECAMNCIPDASCSIYVCMFVCSADAPKGLVDSGKTLMAYFDAIKREYDVSH